MEENKYDDLMFKWMKGGAVAAVIAYIIVVIVATVNGGEFFLNLFGGLIVVPFYIAWLFGVGLVFHIIEKIHKKKDNK